MIRLCEGYLFRDARLTWNCVHSESEAPKVGFFISSKHYFCLCWHKNKNSGYVDLYPLFFKQKKKVSAFLYQK